MKVTFRSGEEGPKHDPYSYARCKVEVSDELTVTLHSGLGEWLCIESGYHSQSLDGNALWRKTDDGWKEDEEGITIFGIFEQLVGRSFDDLYEEHCEKAIQS